MQALLGSATTLEMRLQVSECLCLLSGFLCQLHQRKVLTARVSTREGCACRQCLLPSAVAECQRHFTAIQAPELDKDFSLIASYKGFQRLNQTCCQHLSLQRHSVALFKLPSPGDPGAASHSLSHSVFVSAGLRSWLSVTFCGILFSNCRSCTFFVKLPPEESMFGIVFTNIFQLVISHKIRMIAFYYVQHDFT